MPDFVNKNRALHAFGILALVLASAFHIGKIIDLSVGKKGPAALQQKADAAPSAKSVSDYAAVVEKNPFGIKGVHFSALQKGAGAPADASGLTLKGAITLKPGFAFIENRAAEQRVFKVGDDVFGAGKLASVSADRVMISAGGREIELSLQQIRAVAAPPPSAQSGPGPQRQKKEITFAREQIRKFLDNPNELLTGARLTPLIRDGRQQGFVAQEIRPGSIYETIGLRNEDIILRANQIELNSPGDGVKIFSMIRELDRLELDILRNGTPLTQVFHIN